jgi:predicted O-methyltransferase YrrM
MISLNSPPVSAVLDRLFAEARRNDPTAFDRVNAEIEKLGKPVSARQGAKLIREMPLDRETGRLLYILACSRNAKIIVEFGTSYGISGIHLAAALRDGGGGRLITTAFNPGMAARAQENFRAAGLDDLIDVRIGDPFDTLKGDLGGEIEFLLLDGWAELYLPMLRLLEPRLAPGAMIVADDLATFPEASASYVEFVRAPTSGYVSIEVPLGDRLEISIRT